LQELKKKLAQYELSSTAKACSRLSRNSKDLSHPVAQVIQADESMLAHHTNSNLPYESDDDDLILRRTQPEPKQDAAATCVAERNSWSPSRY
jgi:hypothetical protein